MKRFSVATLLVVPLLAACGGGGASNAPSTPVAPVTPTLVLTAVTVSLAPAAIQVGQTATAAASGFDQNGAPFSIGVPTWTVAPATVATVSATGVVSGVAPGQAIVTASVNGRQGQVPLTVVPIPGPGVPIASLLVRPFSATLTKGQSMQLVATPSDAAGSTLTGRQVGWTSSDSAVATVSASGVVTARSLGTVIIEAESEGQYAGASLTVIGEIDPEIAIEIGMPMLNEVIGDTLKVFASVTSSFQLASVVAQVGPQRVVMDSIEVGKFFHRIAWYGVIDLSTFHFGSYAVTVTATDIRDHRGLNSQPFVRDVKRDGGGGKSPGGNKQALPKVPARIP